VERLRPETAERHCGHPSKVDEKSQMDVEQDAEAERKKRALQQATPQAAKR